jgi:hypothetical protein
MKRTDKRVYESPVMMVVDVRLGGIVCQSVIEDVTEPDVAGEGNGFLDGWDFI